MLNNVSINTVDVHSIELIIMRRINKLVKVCLGDRYSKYYKLNVSYNTKHSYFLTSQSLVDFYYKIKLDITN